MKDLFHLDPITIVIVLAGVIATWTALKKDLAWHSSWIARHEKDCHELRTSNSQIISELRESNARLSTLTIGHAARIDRLEDQVDRAKS